MCKEAGRSKVKVTLVGYSLMQAASIVGINEERISTFMWKVSDSPRYPLARQYALCGRNDLLLVLI
jgi:hypothetical protein